MSVPPPEPELNPYAPPEAELIELVAIAPSDLAEAEAVRRAHITHETSIKALGALHLIGALVGFSWLIAYAGFGIQHAGGGMDAILSIVPLLILLFFTSINLALGIGLRGLRLWARWIDVALIGFALLSNLLSVILAAIWGLGEFELGVPLASSIIPGYILYLLLSPRATAIFSPGYRDIIARTPHVKMKTSWLVKGCLIVLVTFLLLFIVAGFVSFRSFQ